MKCIAVLAVAGVTACSGLLPEAAAQQGSDEPMLLLPESAAQQEVPEEPTLLHATQMMQTADNQALAIATLTQVPRVEPVAVEELPTDEASEEIVDVSVEEFATRYRARIAMLRYSMAANAEVRAALEDANIDLSNVVAAEVRPDLALRVYLWGQ